MSLSSTIISNGSSPEAFAIFTIGPGRSDSSTVYVAVPTAYSPGESSVSFKIGNEAASFEEMTSGICFGDDQSFEKKHATHR